MLLKLVLISLSFTFVFGDPAVGVFQAAGPDDSRSPCPGLNMMANHGYLPRNGKMISKEMIGHAFKIALNVKEADGTFIAGHGFDKLSAAATFDPHGVKYYQLSDLSEHNAVEHDVSLSREDDYFHGDSHSKSMSRIDRLLASSSDGKVITSDDLVKYRVQLAKETEETNPEYYWPVIGTVRFTAYTEAALVLLVIGRNGEIPVKVAETFFKEERIPDGWQKSDVEHEFATLAAYAGHLMFMAI